MGLLFVVVFLFLFFRLIAPIVCSGSCFVPISQCGTVSILV